MNASAFVGRVGGLAVALGVGTAAAAVGSGMAWAAPAEGSSSSAASGASASEEKSTRGQASRRAARSSEPGRAGANPVDVAASVTESRTPPVKVGVRSRGDRAVLPGPAVAPDSFVPGKKSRAAVDLSAASESPSVEVEAVDSIASRVAVVEPVLVAEPPMVQPGVSLGPVGDLAAGGAAVPVMAAAEAAQPAAQGSVVESVGDPVSGPGPAAPLGTAVSWVMLAAARREVGSPAAVGSTLASAAVPTELLLDTPATTATLKSAATQGAVALPSVVRVATAATALTPKDITDITFGGLNSSIGWIPIVGTVINAVKFGIDTVGLVSSVIALDFPRVVTELGNLVVDSIGLVPVVGGPLAALLYQTVLGGNAKLGSWVQGSLQSYLDVDSTWSQFKFNVEAVDVSIGFGGSQPSVATVSKPNYPGAGVIVDVTNTGFETGWSVPLQGRLQLLSLAYS